MAMMILPGCTEENNNLRVHGNTITTGGGGGPSRLRQGHCAPAPYRSSGSAAADRALGQGERDAFLDVAGQHLLGGSNVALECALEQRPVLARRDLAAEDHGDDQVAQIFVEYRRMRIEQLLRAAGRQQRVMEFEVVAFPCVR